MFNLTIDWTSPLAKKKEVPKQISGILIEPSGAVSEILCDNSLQSLWNNVGGYVERVALKDGADAFVNEDGRRLNLPPNPKAQLLVESHGEHPVNGTIVGTALILGGVDARGDSSDVPPWVMEHLGQ